MLSIDKIELCVREKEIVSFLTNQRVTQTPYLINKLTQELLEMMLLSNFCAVVVNLLNN